MNPFEFMARSLVCRGALPARLLPASATPSCADPSSELTVLPWHLPGCAWHVMWHPSLCPCSLAPPWGWTGAGRQRQLPRCNQLATPQVVVAAPVQFGAAMGLDTSRTAEGARRIEGFLQAKQPGEVDSKEVLGIKALIR